MSKVQVGYESRNSNSRVQVKMSRGFRLEMNRV